MKHFEDIIELDKYLLNKGWAVVNPSEKEFKKERRNVKLDSLLQGIASPDFSYELDVDDTCQILTVYNKNKIAINCYSIKTH